MVAITHRHAFKSIPYSRHYNRPLRSSNMQNEFQIVDDLFGVFIIALAVRRL